ncbi:MAG: methyltransferase domain-containing protein, partial [Candidatus Eisenbacteria bacterium]|nr:methyltransferase domain-containing protein [Candidatus Latescibacterota bacterium]MBD3301379.1 methyltransferase domain-containing protein [Candidatus Eisenbacteria bacterium]
KPARPPPPPLLLIRPRSRVLAPKKESASSPHGGDPHRFRVRSGLAGVAFARLRAINGTGGGSVGAKKRRDRKSRIPLSADSADRHLLYEASVQSVDFEVEFIGKTFREITGRKARFLREDFCGTAALACEWVGLDPQNRAIGIDLDGPTLEWGRQRHVAALGNDSSRVELVCDDVRAIRDPKVDAVIAFNYSYCFFKRRDELRDYFRVAHDALADDGLLFVDAFGGTEANSEMIEERVIGDAIAPDGRKIPTFTYIWDQHRFNPVTYDFLCKIHFEFKDGTRFDDAFVYDWRYWTLPEVRELLREAGFRDAIVYAEGWDEEEDDADNEFLPREEIEEMAGWIAYVIGVK